MKNKYPLILPSNYQCKKNQRAPLRPTPEYTEAPEIVPYDDGWPGYDESV